MNGPLLEIMLHLNLPFSRGDGLSPITFDGEITHHLRFSLGGEVSFQLFLVVNGALLEMMLHLDLLYWEVTSHL